MTLHPLEDPLYSITRDIIAYIESTGSSSSRSKSCPKAMTIMMLSVSDTGESVAYYSSHHNLPDGFAFSLDRNCGCSGWIYPL